MNLDSPESSHVDVFAWVEARLRKTREAISREICEVPPPIPACDANVNRLLEDRARVVDELQAWSRLRAQPDSLEALRRFIEAASGLDEASRAAALALLEGVAVPVSRFDRP